MGNGGFTVADSALGWRVTALACGVWGAHGASMDTFTLFVAHISHTTCCGAACRCKLPGLDMLWSREGALPEIKEHRFLWAKEFQRKAVAPPATLMDYCLAFKLLTRSHLGPSARFV